MGECHARCVRLGMSVTGRTERKVACRYFVYLFKLAVLVYKCRQRTAPSYLFEELCQPADFEARRRLRSASSSSLVVRRTRLSTVGDRAFPVDAACTHLERSAAARHVCTLAACFSQSSENASLQTLLSVTPSSFFVVPLK